MREALGLAAERRAEFLPVVERAESLEIRLAAAQGLDVDVERHVAGDRREPPREVRGLAMQRELFRELAGAADRQRPDALEALVDLLERGEIAQERRRRLRPHARHARNVVDRVAGQREEVRHAFRAHAELSLDVAVGEAALAGVVPVMIAVADELREILVARHEHGCNGPRREAGPRSCR